MKKKILIFYDYFLPGFKAGGPVQSLVNLIIALNKEFEFYVITSAYDVNATKPYSSINLNQWNAKLFGNTHINIWYADSKINYSEYKNIICSVNADYVFLNCMYSYRFFIFPILKQNQIFQKETQFIISPRGILQPGSLAIKSTKKSIYLFLLKWSNILNNCSWHATGEEEKVSIQKHFGTTEIIKVISNIPKAPYQDFQYTGKKQNQLKLVHLSLITPVKNIKTLIRVLAQCKQQITLDIYGPIKDEIYWKECIQECSFLPNNISLVYKGDLQPAEVQQVLQAYDSLISLTTGENFGHALFESLSVGRPIITSYFTPWNNLQEKKAGWNVDINDQKSISELLDTLAVATEKDWLIFCSNAHQLAVQYFETQNYIEEYKKLFS